MAKWELNIGNVEYYDSFDRKSLKGNLSIKYNSDEHFKVTLFFESSAGKTVTTALDFEVRTIDKFTGKTKICGEIFFLTPEQNEVILSKKDFFSDKKTPQNVANITSSPQLHLGLVNYYNPDYDDYFVSDIEVKKVANDFEFVIKEYNKTNNITVRINRLIINNTNQVQFENNSQLINCYVSGTIIVLNYSQYDLLDDFLSKWR